MNVEIITPDTTLFKGEAILVQLPGAEGSFEVLQHHAPLIAILQQGRIKLQHPEKNLSFFDIKGGVMEVHDDKVLILAE